jgi:hypothetical protein
MSRQLLLDLSRAAIKESTGATIAARFERFHEANPRVYEHLVRLAYQAKSTGRKRIGIRVLWERLRWWSWFETDGKEPFRLNDKFTSRYVRLLIEREPELAPLFETRELRAA